jgi:wyosine [tRNA(Phe)-imidazoG37] synthetase (radical SAM superfamily)
VNATVKHETLGHDDHRRDVAGLTYIYPVVSRRAKGVSLGINLNINNACNWRCVYCQVPGLIRGGAPQLDLALLKAELDFMLDEILHGRFLAERVPKAMRRLNDIALSGNGEPTSAAQFPEVIEIVGNAMQAFGLMSRIKLVLITNGSLMHRPAVLRGLHGMSKLNGEVWFKVDRATPAGLKAINHTVLSIQKIHDNLVRSAHACPTWIQTCVFNWDHQPMDAKERTAYLEFIAQTVRKALPVKGVLLYGIARPSHQPEAPRLSKAAPNWIRQLARDIRKLGLAVSVFP